MSSDTVKFGVLHGSMRIPPNDIVQKRKKCSVPKASFSCLVNLLVFIQCLKIVQLVLLVLYCRIKLERFSLKTKGFRGHLGGRNRQLVILQFQDQKTSEISGCNVHLWSFFGRSDSDQKTPKSAITHKRTPWPCQ